MQNGNTIKALNILVISLNYNFNINFNNVFNALIVLPYCMRQADALKKTITEKPRLISADV